MDQRPVLSWSRNNRKSSLSFQIHDFLFDLHSVPSTHTDLCWETEEIQKLNNISFNVLFYETDKYTIN